MLQNKFRKRPTRRATVNVNLGTLSAYRLDSVELVLTKCVVKSDFMSVYMGMLDNQVVAVKQLQSGDIAILELFVKEITLQSRAYQWAAPEVLSSNRFSASADIYSLGVILWELESHKVPFADLKNDRTGKRMPEPAVKSLIQQGRATLTFSGAMPPWLYEIALTCLAYDPDQRPSIVKIANAILVGMQPKRAKIGFLTLSKRDLLLLLSFWSVCLTHAAATKLDTVVELFSFHNFLSQDSLTRTWQLSTSLAFCLVVSWTIVFVLATASRHDGTFLRAAKCASGWTI
ncbi:unnamed protein product [Aphanomyces euteiches]